jgi:cation diffusion facilitator CzcD-associated flavoprotein CzcO
MQSPSASPSAPRIAIVGSGFSGLCLGIQLKKLGINSFTIFEKESRLGGTWRDNDYPGSACDLPAIAYCFSFEQKSDWSRKWPPQSEILAYMEHCARKYGLLPHIRFGAEIAGARFDEREGVWRVRTAKGEEIVADVLVCGVGQLNRPFTPKLPGVEQYRGVAFHSARWRHDVDLAGKNVAVIGNAASAIQFIPQIAPRVKHLTILQRSANWMMPRNDRAYTEEEKTRFARYPVLARLYRWWIWGLYESAFPVFLRNATMSGKVERLAREHIRSVVRDPKLQQVLVPDYPVGGKRLLVSDDYYQTLNRENVELVTAGIDRIAEDGVVTKDGRSIPADVLIYGTGFESTSFLAPMEIVGLGGRALHDEWKSGAHAYRGITVADFPNLFLMYGPNTNLGHNSILFMIECQTHYILDCLRQMQERGLRWIAPRRDVMEAYDARVQRELQRTAWAATGKSWYKTEDGRITNNWSGSTIRYWWNTRRANLADYLQRAR